MLKLQQVVGKLLPFAVALGILIYMESYMFYYFRKYPMVIVYSVLVGFMAFQLGRLWEYGKMYIAVNKGRRKKKGGGGGGHQGHSQRFQQQQGGLDG